MHILPNASRMTECFVCLGNEPPLLTGLCACTDRAIHLACQRALVRKMAATDASECAACKTPYTNVETRVVRTCGPHAVILLLPASMFLSASSGGPGELWIYAHTEPGESKHGRLWMVAAGMLLLACGVTSGVTAVSIVVLRIWRGERLLDVFFPRRAVVRIRPTAVRKPLVQHANAQPEVELARV